MKCKKIMLILSFLLCILLIGAVSAASDANEIVEIDDSADDNIELNTIFDDGI